MGRHHSAQIFVFKGGHEFGISAGKPVKGSFEVPLMFPAGFKGLDETAQEIPGGLVPRLPHRESHLESKLSLARVHVSSSEKGEGIQPTDHSL